MLLVSSNTLHPVCITRCTLALRERFHLTRSRETIFFRRQQKRRRASQLEGEAILPRTSAYCARNYSMQIALFPLHRITTDCNVFRRGIYAALPNNTWLNTLLQGVGRATIRDSAKGMSVQSVVLSVRSTRDLRMKRLRLLYRTAKSNRRTIALKVINYVSRNASYLKRI